MIRPAMTLRAVASSAMAFCATSRYLSGVQGMSFSLELLRCGRTNGLYGGRVSGLIRCWMAALAPGVLAAALRSRRFARAII